MFEYSLQAEKEILKRYLELLPMKDALIMMAALSSDMSKHHTLNTFSTMILRPYYY